MSLNYKIAAFADEASGELAGQIKAMKDNGVSMLEMRGVDGFNPVSITLDHCKEIRSQLEANGLSVWSIGSPCGKDQIADDFTPQLDRMKHVIDVAVACGASRIRMFSFHGCQDAAATRDEVLYRLTRFCEAAEGSGVKLCHENEKGIYGDNAERCNDILRNVPALGGIFDPANFLQCNQPTVEAWELLKDRIDYFHIKDVNAQGKIVPAGCGDGHIPELLKDYLKNGGQVMTLEPHLKIFDALKAIETGEKSQIENAYASSEEAFAAAANALKKILAEI